jgi:hypothetical protein
LLSPSSSTTLTLFFFRISLKSTYSIFDCDEAGSERRPIAPKYSLMSFCSHIYSYLVLDVAPASPGHSLMLTFSKLATSAVEHCCRTCQWGAPSELLVLVSDVWTEVLEYFLLAGCPDCLYCP